MRRSSEACGGVLGIRPGHWHAAAQPDRRPANKAPAAAAIRSAAPRSAAGATPCVPGKSRRRRRLAAEKPTASAMACGVMSILQLANSPTAKEVITPSAMPRAPPIIDSVTASTRNCLRMSRPRAPTAMRSPISRVRSVTLTSMMFMMPMPPTSSDTEATAPRSSVSTRLAASCACKISVRLRIVNGSSAPGCTFMRCRSSSLIFSSIAFMSAPSAVLTEIVPTRRCLPCVWPSTRLRAVEIGISTMSSWSWPSAFCPLRSSTPITSSGTLRTRITSSTGSASPKSCCAVVSPISATLPAPLISFGSNRRPDASGQSRAIR